MQTWKAHALARNLAPHMIAGGYITAIAAPFPDACDRALITADMVITLVDNNECRLEALRYARSLEIPAIFSMLSRDAGAYLSAGSQFKRRLPVVCSTKP